MSPLTGKVEALTHDMSEIWRLPPPLLHTTPNDPSAQNGSFIVLFEIKDHLKSR